MERGDQKYLQAVWDASGMVCADDPEARVRCLFDRSGWADIARLNAIGSGDETIVLNESRSVNTVCAVLSRLPPVLDRAINVPARAYMVCVTRMRSNRPWRVEWVVPVDESGTLGCWVVDQEYSTHQLEMGA